MSMTLVDESMQQEEESVVDNKCILALSSINLDVCRGELCCIIVSIYISLNMMRK